MFGELLLEMDVFPTPFGPTPRGISSSPKTEVLGGAGIRLLEFLKSPLDSRILGRQIVREIVYLVLQREQGVVRDATAAPRHPQLGDGCAAALVNYRFIANAVLSTDEAVKGKR